MFFSSKDNCLCFAHKKENAIKKDLNSHDTLVFQQNKKAPSKAAQRFFILFRMSCLPNLILPLHHWL